MLVLITLTIFETKCEVSTTALPLFLPPGDLGMHCISALALALGGWLSVHSEGMEPHSVLEWGARGTLGGNIRRRMCGTRWREQINS